MSCIELASLASTHQVFGISHDSQPVQALSKGFAHQCSWGCVVSVDPSVGVMQDLLVLFARDATHADSIGFACKAHLRLSQKYSITRRGPLLLFCQRGVCPATGSREKGFSSQVPQTWFRLLQTLLRSLWVGYHRLLGVLWAFASHPLGAAQAWLHLPVQVGPMVRGDR